MKYAFGGEWRLEGAELDKVSIAKSKQQTQKEQTIARKNKVRKWNKYSAGTKIKKHSNHFKKEYFPQPICSWGLSNLNERCQSNNRQSQS